MRPGGLSALGIFNFVFGGLEAIGELLTLAVLSSQYPKMVEQAQRNGQDFPSVNLLYVLALFGLVRAGLLISSGVGYFGMKKFLGRMLGNGYAVAALIALVIEITQAPANFTAFNLIGFVYPLITLFMLNVVFKKDLVR